MFHAAHIPVKEKENKFQIKQQPGKLLYSSLRATHKTKSDQGKSLDL